MVVAPPSAPTTGALLLGGADADMILALGGSAHAYCPCYSPSSSKNTYHCAIEGVAGVNPTLAQWQSVFALVSKGPAAWGSAGPAVGALTQGCGKPQTARPVAARFPCELLKAMAMQESGWRQFCVTDVPSDEIDGGSRTIISFDCGYGVSQVTSGMHIGEAPTFDRARVASDATYNLATGTRILHDKWQYPYCVGDKQPEIIEHWYTAIWAYNGLSYSNNPNNPTFSSTRGVYNPAVGGAAPYQEKVFGLIEHPPSAAHWSPVALAYPTPGSQGSSGAPPDLAEPTCASPTSCASKRPIHRSACLPGPSDGGTVDSGTPDAGRADAGRTFPNDAGMDQPSIQQFPYASGGLGAAPSGCGCSSMDGAPMALLMALISACALRRRQRPTLR